MKRILLAIPLLLLLFMTSGCVISRPKVLSPLCSCESVTGMRIPPATMKISGMFCDDDESGIVKHISTVEIVSSENGTDESEFSNIMQQIVSGKKMQLLMSVQSPGEAVDIYGVTDKKGINLKEMILATSEKNELVVIYLKGKISIVDMMGDEPDNIGDILSGNCHNIVDRFK